MKIWQGIRKNWHLLALFIGNHKNWALLALFILLALIAVKGFGVLFSYIFGEDIYVFLKTMSSGQEKITRMNEVGASIIGYALAIAGVLVTMLIAFLGLRNSELQVSLQASEHSLRASEYIEEKIEHAAALYARLGSACANAFYLAYEAPFTEQIPDEGLTENSLQLREAEEFHQRMLEALDKIASALEAMSESYIAKELFPDMSRDDSYFKIIESEQWKQDYFPLHYFPLHPAFQSEYPRIKYEVDKEEADEAVSQADRECSQHAATRERTELPDDSPTDEQLEDVEAQYRADPNYKQEKEKKILERTVLALAKKKSIRGLIRCPATYSECAFLIRDRMRLLKKADIRRFPFNCVPYDTETDELDEDELFNRDKTPDKLAAYWLGYYMGFEVHYQEDNYTHELVPIVPSTDVPNKNRTGVERKNIFRSIRGYVAPKENEKELERPRDVFFYAHTGFALLHDLLCGMTNKEAFKEAFKETVEKYYPDRKAVIDKIPFEKVMVDIPPALSSVLGKKNEKKEPWLPLAGYFVDLESIYACSNKTCLKAALVTANRWDFRRHFTAS